jgi:hypothetical protein
MVDISQSPLFWVLILSYWAVEVLCCVLAELMVEVTPDTEELELELPLAVELVVDVEPPPKTPGTPPACWNCARLAGFNRDGVEATIRCWGVCPSP